MLRDATDSVLKILHRRLGVIIRVTRYLQGFLSLGFLFVGCGVGIMLGGLILLCKENFVGAGIFGLVSVIFFAGALVQVHEERFHKK